MKKTLWSSRLTTDELLKMYSDEVFETIDWQSPYSYYCELLEDLEEREVMRELRIGDKVKFERLGDNDISGIGEIVELDGSFALVYHEDIDGHRGGTQDNDCNWWERRTLLKLVDEEDQGSRYYLLDRMRSIVVMERGQIFFEWFDKDRFDYEMEDYSPTEIAEMINNNKYFDIEHPRWGWDNGILVSWTEEEFREELDHIEDEIILEYAGIIDDSNLLHNYLKLKGE